MQWVERLRRHFRRQVAWYDATRWALLPGRRRLLRRLAPAAGTHALEIGCGTGHLLAPLAAAAGPAGRVVGIDLSPEMLARAARRCRRLPQVELRQEVFGPRSCPGERFDLVLLAYSLSMTPAPEAVIQRAVELLRPGGRLAVVDFHDAGAMVRRLLRAFPLRLAGAERELLAARTAPLAGGIWRPWPLPWRCHFWIAAAQPAAARTPACSPNG